MEKRPIQITMRGILLATFWMAICFACWACMSRQVVTNGFMVFVATCLYIGSPFIAAGALVGRTANGLFVALGVVLYLWFVALSR